MATSNEKFLNYNGLVKLIGLIKKRINDAVGSIDLSWKTNKFVKSIAGYGSGAAPASTSGVNDTKNKLEGTYTTGNLDGTGTDTSTNKFTYIDTTYGAASTSKAGLMSAADKTMLGNLGATGASKGANLVKYDGTATTTAGSVAEAIKNLQGAVGGGDLVKSVDDASQDSANYGDVNIVPNYKRIGNYTKADGTPGTYKYYDTRYGLATATSGSGLSSVAGLNGLMSAADKTKLDGVASGAQVNVIEHVRLAGESTDLTVTSKRVTIPNATTATSGLLSAEDKQKLDGVADGAINGIAYGNATADVYEGIAQLDNIVNELTLTNLPSDDPDYDNLGQELRSMFLPMETTVNGQSVTIDNSGSNTTYSYKIKSGHIQLTSNISVDGSSKSDVQSALVALNTLAASNKSAIATIQSAGLTREVVTALPTGSNIKTNVIYMILASNDTMNSGDPSTGATTTPFSANSNSYNEYMYINSAWERIGSTEVNLDIDPITNDEIDTAWSTTAAAA